MFTVSLNQLCNWESAEVSLVLAVLRLCALHFTNELINFTFQACYVSVKVTNTQQYVKNSIYIIKVDMGMGTAVIP